MVGTVEPRKGHAQVLAAFELLWTKGYDIDLVIVGKEGGMVEALTNKLRQHFEAGQRLWWLKDVSDEYLVQIYRVSTCLIAASLGEGFGLPLIEAAKYQLPIIARDIHVFREVAGSHAYYFADTTAQNLAKAVVEWLQLKATLQQPGTESMPWLTWQQSASQLMRCILPSKN